MNNFLIYINKKTTLPGHILTLLYSTDDNMQVTSYFRLRTIMNSIEKAVTYNKAR